MKWRKKEERENGNEDVCLQPRATTSARDDECSSNGSDQINTKCGKTHQMCSRYFEYYLNTCHVVKGGGKNGWKLPSRVWREEVGA